MKSMCSALVALLLCISTPRADDRIEFYADAAMSTCMVMDVTPSLVQIHMVHAGSLPGDGVIFSAYNHACWIGATWLGDIIVTNPTGVLNNTHSSEGFGLVYHECLQPPVYLGYMSFFTSGQGLPCCEYSAHPNRFGNFGVHECGTQFTYRPLSTRPAIINGNASCPCELPVSTVETTWGRVKAFYR